MHSKPSSKEEFHSLVLVATLPEKVLSFTCILGPSSKYWIIPEWFLSFLWHATTKSELWWLLSHPALVPFSCTDEAAQTLKSGVRGWIKLRAVQGTEKGKRNFGAYISMYIPLYKKYGSISYLTLCMCLGKIIVIFLITSVKDAT